jgi:ketosteroid isomerase-like protein
MTEVIDRLAAAMNAHDLDAVAGLIHQDYRSEQPAHPGRAFTGRAQMLANWEAMLAGIPDFCAEIRRSVHDGDTAWTEWRWPGTRGDGQTTARRAVDLCGSGSARALGWLRRTGDLRTAVAPRAGQGRAQRRAG